ncbi:MAG: hypothetical protein AAF382_14035 [Pseudomonadota bacterium]
MPRRWVLVSAGLFGLSGCLGSDFSGFGAGGDVKRDVIRTVTLYEGDVVVRGPDGYCIDRRSMRDRASQGFVVLASCESLSGVRGQEVEPVIMTLTVLPGRAGATRPSATQIAASKPDMAVIKAVEGEDLSLVHFANGGDQALAGKDPRHWRGAMTVNGHLIGLALYARRGGQMAGDVGQGLLIRLAQNTKSSSPVRPQVVATTAEETGAPPPGSLGALLGGLFPDSS